MAEEKGEVLKLALRREARHIVVEDIEGRPVKLAMLDPREISLAQKSVCLRVANFGVRFAQGELDDKEVLQMSEDLNKVVLFMVPELRSYLQNISDDDKLSIVQVFFKEAQRNPATLSEEGKPIQMELPL